MLALLKIRNLAIVSDLEIEFGPGLNVLTGETGAGKSIILKAIELLGGRRSSSDVIRSGAAQCEIEGLFQLTPELQKLLQEEFEELESLIEEDEIIIRRLIDSAGKGRIYLNGRLVTAGVLQGLSSRLMDITSQHEAHSLLDAANHRTLLDRLGVAPELLSDVEATYSVYAAAKERYDSFLKDSAAKQDYFRRIGFERDELKEARLQIGEREDLERELKRLSSFEKLSGSISDALNLLEGGEESVDSQLRRIGTILLPCGAIDRTLDEPNQLVDSAAVQLREAARMLSQYGAGINDDPTRLEFLRERIAEVARLERKYQKDTSGLIYYLTAIEAELAEFESGGFDEESLRIKVEEARSKLAAFEVKLTAARKKAGEKLSKLVEAELEHLNMKRARFGVEISPGASSRHGADLVEFVLAANPGEPARALSKVASGGELSRVLLILKTILNEKITPLLQIFDEVDTGIGGAVAQVVGEKLRTIAESGQVLVVTHAPQIASLAEHHFLIAKESSESATTVSVSKLPEASRVREIARMMAGKEVTQKFEDSARELIKSGAQYHGNTRNKTVKPGKKEKRSKQSIAVD